MLKFNLNDYVFVQITNYGWNQLEKSVSNNYINHCILPNKTIIDNKTYYKLQGHQMIELFGNMLFCSSHYPIESNILLQETEFINLKYN